MSDPTTPAVPDASPVYAAAPPADGSTAPAAFDSTTTPAKSTALLSILSLVAGGVSFLFGWLPYLIPFIGGVLGLVVPIAAVVLGFLGKKREPNAAKGLWLAGIVLGFVGIVVSLGALIFWIVLAIAAQSDSSITPYNYFD